MRVENPEEINKVLAKVYGSKGDTSADVDAIKSKGEAAREEVKAEAEEARRNLNTGFVDSTPIGGPEAESDERVPRRGETLEERTGISQAATPRSSGTRTLPPSLRRTG